MGVKIKIKSVFLSFFQKVGENDIFIQQKPSSHYLDDWEGSLSHHPVLLLSLTSSSSKKKKTGRTYVVGDINLIEIMGYFEINSYLLSSKNTI